MSLRTRLILTHIFLILLTLGIVAVSLFFILNTFQRQVQLARLGDAVVPVAVQAQALLQTEITPREIVLRLSPQVRGIGQLVLVSERGVVLADTGLGLTNRSIGLNPLNRPEPQRNFFSGSTINRNNGRVMLYSAIAAGQLGGQTVYIALAAQERPFVEVLDEIGLSLAIAGSIALLVSLLVALLLARSIASPITRLTRATEALARGQYDHRVPGNGTDEMGRLAQSFNGMAEQVQRARQMEKDFVANVSHELKTPLTSIQGFAQAILDGAVTDMVGAHRAAQTIFNETARMGRLIGDLLTLARFESGQLPLAKQTINLTDALPRWVERFQLRAKENEETLVTIVDAVPPVSADPGRLEQVISNLVDNALKYNHPGGSVKVSAKLDPVPSPEKSTTTLRRSSGQVLRRRAAEHPDAARAWVAISVADTGGGIPQEDLPRLFDRFYRGDKARVAGGSGLGLAIANEIIAAHGGKITVESEIGRGSTFTVHLPIKNRAGEA